MFLKVLYAHQGCIYLIIKTVILLFIPVMAKLNFQKYGAITPYISVT